MTSQCQPWCIQNQLLPAFESISFLVVYIRPKEKNIYMYALFPVTCAKLLGSVGRQTFFYKIFFVWKKYEILKNSLKIDFNIPIGFKKSLSRSQNIRVGRVNGNKTFSFFGLIYHCGWDCCQMVFASIHVFSYVIYVKKYVETYSWQQQQQQQQVIIEYQRFLCMWHYNHLC